jgi:hypothetical protein
MGTAQGRWQGFLLEGGCGRASRRAAVGARVDGCPCCSGRALEWALVSCGLASSGRLLLRAARTGQLEQLSWLRARGCAWEPCRGYGDDCCSSAAAGGHLAVLQWPRADGCPWDARTCTSAAQYGHVAVLQ